MRGGGEAAAQGDHGGETACSCKYLTWLKNREVRALISVDTPHEPMRQIFHHQMIMGFLPSPPRCERNSPCYVWVEAARRSCVRFCWA